MPICSFCQRIGTLKTDDTCLPSKDHKESQNWPWNADELKSKDRVEHIDDILRLIDSASQCWMCDFFLRLLDFKSDRPEENLVGQRIYLETLNTNHFTQSLDMPVHKVIRIPFIVKAGTSMARSPSVNLVGLNLCWRSKPFALATSEGTLSHRAIWSSMGRIRFKDRVPLIHDWMQECKNFHPSCVIDGSMLPSRLIDVGEGHSPLLPHLVITEKYKFPFGPYCALSYCWGQTTISVKTVQTNLAMQCLQIDTKDVPKTLYDAMIITRNLGVRYLWIDALCIIQDDPLDWEKESAKMASIFKNAYLTIAGTSAADCHGGCFLDSLAPSRGQIDAKDGASSYCTTFIRNSVLTSTPINYAPLNQRGWTLQETLLSTRVLHFTEDQVFWQCRTRFASEDGTHDRNLTSLTQNPRHMRGMPWCAISPHRLQTSKDIYQTWYMTARHYSSRKLTYSRDKIAAFAGLTKYFQDLTGDSSVLGLWTKDIIRQLAWKPSDLLDRSRNEFIPSWSWLSFNGEFDPLLFEIGNSPTHAAEVVCTDIQWSGEPLTSTLKASKLILKGRLRTMQTARYDSARYDSARYDSARYDFGVCVPGLYNSTIQTQIPPCYIQPFDTPRGAYRSSVDPWAARHESGSTVEFYFDEHVWRENLDGSRSLEFTPTGTEVVTLLLLAEENGEQKIELMLLLKLASKTPRVYRRIGVAVHNHKTYFGTDDAMECFKDIKETLVCLQ